MRLIDAEEAFETADEFSAFEEGLADKTDLKDLLNICDTIEAKPVVHAHWETDFDFDPEEEQEIYFYFCSKCKNELFGNKEDFKYCPYCGAQMDGTDTNVGSKGVKIPVISMEDVPKIMEEMEK